MSEKKEAVKLPPLSVARCDVTMDMEISSFGKKSPNYGKQFYHPTFTKDNWDNSVKWWGQDTIEAIVQTEARKIGQRIFMANVDEETGEFDVDGFKSDMIDLAVSRVTLSDLEERMDELQVKQEALVNDPDFGEPNERGAQLLVEVRNINKQLQPLRNERAAIEAEYAVRAEKRKATKAAKKAKAEAAKAEVAEPVPA